jgi:tellurite resistance protein
VGSKGLKVVGAAVATAAIDGVFDRNPKEHVLRHIAVAMVEGAVMDAFASSSPLGN